MARKKISILGAGRVGSTAAQLAAFRELGDVILWNRSEGTAKGIALDIAEAAPIAEFDVSVTGTGDLRETRNSDVVAITAGAPRKPGMSRDELLGVNAGIVRPLAAEAAKHSPKAVLVIVTNPLDAMVFAAWRAARLPRDRVVGMAGILDSSRFRTFVAAELGVAVEDVTALVLGGHGDFMVPLPRHTLVNGVPLPDLLPKKKIDALAERTRNAGAEILALEKDSSAFIAPAASLVQMIESIVKDKKRVVPCAALLDGQYGIKGIFMGVPVVLGEKGVEKIIELELTKAERAAMEKSAAKVRELLGALR